MKCDKCNKTRAYFNFPGQKKAIYCSKCKEEGMVDVVSKKCQCGTRPIYNFEGKKKGICCSKCKEDGMINVVDKKCKCGKAQPIYNFEGKKKAICCSKCKEDGMINVKDKRCKSHMCDIFVSNPRYRGHCLRCFIYLFPDEPNVRNYKTKEQSVVDFVNHIYGEKYSFTFDKTIQDGCSRRRPDIILDLGYQIIIVEVDENQHTDYDCSCENKRTMELSQDVRHRNIVFIRFNPDKYYKGKKLIKSCWKLNGNGIIVVDKEKEWKFRLNCLKEEIDYWINNKTNKTIEIVQLFYDEN